jgi:hypothetical protein
VTLPILMYGKVTTQKDSPLSNVHVINITTKSGTITDHEGLYSTNVYANDTVRFTSIGFKTTLFIVPGVAENILQTNLTLYSDTLNLTEFVIRPYPKDYQALKREFLVLELPDEQKINMHLEEVLIQGPIDAGMVIKGPFTALYEAFSRHAKILKQYENLIRQDKLKLSATKRYNSKIVMKITGIKEEEELFRFMEYCKLEPEYILKVNDYDLYSAIKECYRRFKSDRN